MAAITMEHRHARYAGVAQIVLGVLSIGGGHGMASALSLALAASGIALVLATPANLTRRASVNWWVCLVWLLLAILIVGSGSFIASGVLQAEIVGLATQDTGKLGHDYCSSTAREARGADEDSIVSAATLCGTFRQHLDNFPEDDVAAVAHGCYSDCMNYIQAMADDTSAFNQAATHFDPAWVVAGWSAVVVVAGCVWASSRAGGASAPETASYPGEPQDLPDHRMSPSAAVVRGWRKSCTKAGRASRSEYWYFVLFVAVSLVLCHLQMTFFISFSDWVPALYVYNGTVHPDLMVDEFAEIWGGFVSLMKLALPLLLCSSLVCATTRRLHDTGHSGWCLVLALGLTPLGIPSPLFVMPWLLQGSEPRRNAFGAVPTNGSAWEESDLATPIEATCAALTAAKAEIAQLKSQPAAVGQAPGFDAAADPLSVKENPDVVQDCESPVQRDTRASSIDTRQQREDTGEADHHCLPQDLHRAVD